jgi:hypothetical protein
MSMGEYIKSRDKKLDVMERKCQHAAAFNVGVDETQQNVSLMLESHQCQRKNMTITNLLLVSLGVSICSRRWFFFYGRLMRQLFFSLLEVKWAYTSVTLNMPEPNVEPRSIRSPGEVLENLPAYDVYPATYGASVSSWSSWWVALIPSEENPKRKF